MWGWMMESTSSLARARSLRSHSVVSRRATDGRTDGATAANQQATTQRWTSATNYALCNHAREEAGAASGQQRVVQKGAQ